MTAFSSSGAGQPNIKARMSRAALHPDVAVVFPNDLLHDIQAEAAAFARGFGCEKGLEDPVSDRFRDAAAAVAYRDHDRSIVERGFDLEGAFVLHGLE